MRQTKWIIVAWLVLVVATLLIGGVAARSLRHEDQRLRAAFAAAAEQRARAAAGTIRLAIVETQQGVVAALREMAADRLPGNLDRWRAGNPLVRNVFLWAPQRGLLFPDPNDAAGAEEAAFAVRYSDLFGGRRPWESRKPGPEGRVDSGSVRLELRDLALKSVARREEAAGSSGARLRSGWIPWYSENQLHFLGWVEDPTSGQRFGVELETMALFSRLLPGFPVPADVGEGFALMDGNNGIFHQTGVDVGGEGVRRVAAAPVGPEVPHWQVAVFSAAGPAGGGRAIALVSWLLVGVLLVAILSGGGTLLWQAHRNLVDARQKTTFVSNVSHELKTPLTTIRMYAELLEEERVREPARRAECLRIMVSESERLTRIVNNVLDFSRLEQGRKTYALAALDLNAVAAGLLDVQEPRLREAGLPLHREPSWNRAVRVRADRDAVEQILLNLLDNAIKYAGQGGEVTAVVKEERDAGVLQILDRGPGIPPAAKAQVFESFFRVDDSLTVAKPGSGLGLSIARQLARGMGGDLTCRERDGGGTCFELRLPAWEREVDDETDTDPRRGG
jgi:signal transduction histidine kinase